MLNEMTRLGLPRFETLIYKRAAYREAFLTGKPAALCRAFPPGGEKGSGRDRLLAGRGDRNCMSNPHESCRQ